ncbi:hypothetical protein QM012_005499 [Aureobasidium pullulans]|uniref:Uncharacterized protein n=1 Tax=Aureobasidium pullulans TaxID=5580 RepID=A0ABR0T4L6_AURPU
MRFSIFTISAAVAAAAGTNAIDVAEVPGYVPGYEAIPKAATNKYSQRAHSAIPGSATGSFEPTYMPEEDLKPSSIHARSVISTSATAKPTPMADEPADDSYEAFLEWTNARLAEATPEQAQHSHVARSEAPTSTAKAAPLTDAPSDDTYEAFVTWMESRYPEAFSEQVKQKINARDAPPEPQHTTTTSTTTSTTATPTAAASPIAGPAGETYEEFLHWMNVRFPEGLPEEEEHQNFARSVDEYDDYSSADYHDLHARSVDTPEASREQEHGMSDWDFAFNEEMMHHLQARSAENPSNYEHEYGQDHSSDVHAAFESEYPHLEETFEEFLVRQGYSPEQYAEESKATESYEEEPKPQTIVNSKPSVSEVAASPAAAPTPKPTSAITPSATTSTSASQWSSQMSETATFSSSSPSNVQARSVSSHYRFRHHSHSAHASDSGTASASSATSSTTTSRKGFFNIPW